MKIFLQQVDIFGYISKSLEEFVYIILSISVLQIFVSM